MEKNQERRLCSTISVGLPTNNTIVYELLLGLNSWNQVKGTR